MKRILLLGIMSALAFNLTLRIEYEDIGTEGSSSRADGSQCLYKALWNAKVPHKVQLFA
jgi:hypothetical protein